MSCELNKVVRLCIWYKYLRRKLNINGVYLTLNLYLVFGHIHYVMYIELLGYMFLFPNIFFNHLDAYWTRCLPRCLWVYLTLSLRLRCASREDDFFCSYYKKCFILNNSALSKLNMCFRVMHGNNNYLNLLECYNIGRFGYWSFKLFFIFIK